MKNTATIRGKRKRRARLMQQPSASPQLNGGKLAYRFADLEALGLGGRAYLYKQIAAGKLRATKLGRHTVFLRQDVEDFIAMLPVIEPRKQAMAAAE